MGSEIYLFGGCKMMGKCFDDFRVMNVTDACPNNCTGRGTCRNNRCNCNDGFSGKINAYIMGEINLTYFVVVCLVTIYQVSNVSWRWNASIIAPIVEYVDPMAIACAIMVLLVESAKCTYLVLRIAHLLKTATVSRMDSAIAWKGTLGLLARWERRDWYQSMWSVWMNAVIKENAIKIQGYAYAK